MLNTKKNRFQNTENLGWVIYIFLTLFTALNISSERFGSPDDLSITTMQTSEGGLLNLAKQAATSQGRIQQILFYTLDNIGLSEKYSFVTPTIKFCSVITILFLFSYLIHILYSKNLSLLASLFLISTIATSGEYNALNSFPLWFTAGIITFLISLLLFMKLTKSQQNLTLTLFGLTSLFSLLSSEVFFLVFLTYPLLHLKISRENKFVVEVKKMKKTYTLICLNLFIYFVVYVLFKLLTNGSYEGASLTLENPFKSTLSAMALSTGQANIYGLKRQILENQLNFNLFFIIIYAIVFTVLFINLKSQNGNHLKIQNTEIISILILALLGNLILGFTYKYSKIGLIYPLYLNSLISYLFVSLAAALVIIKIFNNIYSRFIILLCISVFGYLSFTDQQIVYNQIKINQNVFKVAACMKNNAELISQFNSQILSPDMQKLSKSYSYNYFGEKFRLKTGRNFQFYQDLALVDPQKALTKIDMKLSKDFAVGKITNEFESKTLQVIDYQIIYANCNFKLDYLTPSQPS